MATNELKSRIKHAYKTESEWSSSNPVLLKGEVAYSSDKANKHKVGDGTSTWSQLAYVLPSKSDIGLGNVENKSSATIRGELTKANVTTALGYTPPTTNTTYGVATSSALGLVKSGTDITVDSSGNVSVNDDSHNHVISNVDGLQSALDGKSAKTTLTNQDLNSVVTPGFYNAGGGNTVTNKPSGIEHFGLIVIHRASGSYYTQIIFNDTSSYRRFCVNGTWGSWTQDQLTDTDTWRGIQNNLTSDSTTDSLSAAQGKALKALVDGKAASSHGNHVPTTQTANNAVFLRNDNTWQTVTPANIGAAASSHTHSSYVNQNAFGNITVGSTTVTADSATDTLTLVAGLNITLTPDATNDKITIASKDTVYTHPTTTGNKHIPSGGSSGQILRWSADGTAAWGADNNTTYSAGTGISLSGTTFSNSGVRSIATGGTNGTISVNTNGTSAEVAVKGLGSAAYTESSAYATSGHKHNNYVTNINSISSSGLEIGSYDTESVSDVSSIYVQYASGTQAGVVSTSSQTFAGNKTFSNIAYFKAGLLTGEKTTYNDGKVGCYVAGSGYIQIQSTGTPTLYFFKGTETSSNNYIYSDGDKLGFKSKGTIAVNNGMSLDGNLKCVDSITVGQTTYNNATDVSTKTVKVLNSNNNVSISASTSAGLYHHTDSGSSSSKWLIYINTSGTVTANTSDRRWKVDKGILDSQEAKTILKNIDIINFIYKDDVGKNNLEQPGIYAQDLRDVLINNNYPNRGYLTLSNFKEEEECCEPSYDISLPEEDNRYDVDYSKFIPVLWKGWQGHDTQIDNNINEIAQLKETINVLLQEIEQLKKSNAS